MGTRKGLNKSMVPFRKRTLRRRKARTLPRVLVLVRHGESEQNKIIRLAKGGDFSSFTRAYRSTHSSKLRLTPRGEWQAQVTGAWIRETLPYRLHAHYHSPYIRAMQTAGLLALPNARWRERTWLRERDWGEIDALTLEERDRIFPGLADQKRRDGVYWTPPGGESKIRQLERSSLVLDTLARQHSGQDVILVSHGDTMATFLKLLGQLTDAEWAAWHDDPGDNAHLDNCQVVVFSQVNPEDPRDLRDRYEWAGWACPWDPARATLDWRPIPRKRYGLSNEELLALTVSAPRFLPQEE
ncbi:histidine phosphatase family protein [Candidatus Berkelbacteria bacterium]|nr:histidine phosphatase family protein [Candidatus Berkelbacteria bacterium]